MFLVRTLPTPLGGGGDLRRLGIARALGELGPVTVVGVGAGDDPAAALPPKGAALAEAVGRGESPFAVRESTTAAVEVEVAIREFAPDVVVISGLELARYVDIVRPRARRVVVDLDYAQSHATQELARADRNPRRSLLWRHAASSVAEAEAAILQTVDDVWLGHAAEIALLDAVPGRRARFTVVPNAVDGSGYPRAERSDPDQLVFPARFDFWPNEDAARELVDGIGPRLPGVRMCLVGQAPPGWLTARAGEQVTVTGPVPDVRPYLAAAAAMPVPLRAGAGTRFKALEAFVSGVPVVSTAKGVEGLGLEDGIHYLRAESTDDFVAALEVARRDTAEARRCIASSRELLDREFSLAALDAAVRAALSESGP